MAKLSNVKGMLSKNLPPTASIKAKIINPIKILATSYKNKKIKLIAVNEASLFRQSRQTASIQIIENKKMILKKLIGDGILISTPAGSTAYNYSANGPILTLRSGKLSVPPISPFRPRKWKGKIVSNKSVIKIKKPSSGFNPSVGFLPLPSVRLN